MNEKDTIRAEEKLKQFSAGQRTICILIQLDKAETNLEQAKDYANNLREACDNELMSMACPSFRSAFQIVLDGGLPPILNELMKREAKD